MEKLEEEIFEEGFSPERSPTKQLKKKPLIMREETALFVEKGDEGLKERKDGLWEGFLRNLKGFCKC